MSIEESNCVLAGDAQNELSRLDDESVQLTVTSPPYNIGIDYGDDVDDRMPLSEWTGMMRDIFEELFRVTKPDGKVAVNVGYSYGRTKVEGRYFRIPLNQYIMEIAQDVGFDMYDEFVWVKNSFASHGGGALFGSYPYPTNFMANQQHEYILVFRKWVSDSYYRTRELPPKGTDKRENSALTKEEWKEYTKSVWEIEPASKDAVGIDHDAMFPVEIPKRLIRLYSFVGDTVLDPFFGTGTTGVAAKRWDRDYVGIEQNDEYVAGARKRLQGEIGTREERKRQEEVQQQAEADGQQQRTLDDLE